MLRIVGIPIGIGKVAASSHGESFKLRAVDSTRLDFDVLLLLWFCDAGAREKWIFGGSFVRLSGSKFS